MHLTVHEVSAYFVTTTPEAASFIDSRLICASPVTMKSAPFCAGSPLVFRPGAEAERLDALLQQVLGERRRLRRRVRLIGVRS